MTCDWPAIVTEFGPLVWRTAYRLLGNHADAADCFQQTFLGAVEVVGGEHVATWAGLLKRLATARALEHLRVRYRETRRTGPLPETPPAGRVALDPLSLAAARELAVALRQALATIDPLQAQTFCLVCLEGLSYREAAEQLGVTANHAGVLLNRGRAALQKRLSAFDPHRERLPGGPP